MQVPGTLNVTDSNLVQLLSTKLSNWNPIAVKGTAIVCPVGGMQKLNTKLNTI
jgi:hypothetical protein